MLDIIISLNNHIEDPKIIHPKMDSRARTASRFRTEDLEVDGEKQYNVSKPKTAKQERDR
jgi:hypothetical protein